MPIKKYTEISGVKKMDLVEQAAWETIHNTLDKETREVYHDSTSNEVRIAIKSSTSELEESGRKYNIHSFDDADVDVMAQHEQIQFSLYMANPDVDGYDINALGFTCPHETADKMSAKMTRFLDGQSYFDGIVDFGTVKASKDARSELTNPLKFALGEDKLHWEEFMEVLADNPFHEPCEATREMMLATTRQKRVAAMEHWEAQQFKVRSGGIRIHVDNGITITASESDEPTEFEQNIRGVFNKKKKQDTDRRQAKVSEAVAKEEERILNAALATTNGDPVELLREVNSKSAIDETSGGEAGEGSSSRAPKTQEEARKAVEHLVHRMLDGLY